MLLRATALVGAVGLFGGAALADPLNLNLPAFPDIYASLIDVNYNATSHLLSAIGHSVTFEDDGLPSTPAHLIFSGQFLLNVQISNAGAPMGGTLSISGGIPELSIPNQLLLSGTLTNFGFNTAGVGNLEFIFGSLGGALAPAYLAHGSSAGINLGNVQGFPHNFTTDWNNLTNGQPGTGMAVADTGSVPAPGGGAAALLALGVMSLGRRRR